MFPSERLIGFQNYRSLFPLDLATAMTLQRPKTKISLIDRERNLYCYFGKRGVLFLCLETPF